MPVLKNKPTTSTPLASTPESSSPVMPEQEEFRQYLLLQLPQTVTEDERILTEDVRIVVVD